MPLRFDQLRIVVVGSDVIYYQFSREKVERGDFTHFLNLYGLDKTPEGPQLRKLMGSMVFCIEGWDQDPREIHLIPEIRRFYSTFHEAWPYWLYFCNLEVDTLRAMTMCCLGSINALQVDGSPKVSVTCDPTDLLNFLKQDFLPMNFMCERSGMSERGIYDWTREIFQYFNFPFDVGPPPTEDLPVAGLGVPGTTVDLGKVGRNDPCPCGSGKKFKKCCGR